MMCQFDIVILGLSITSSWGNGHATTWRSLVRGLSGLGYKVLFLERDMPWYAENRDNRHPEGATTILYHSLDELFSVFEPVIASAALVIVGSFVPEGIAVGEWVVSIATGYTAFYDIDTPVTLAKLKDQTADYISKSLIRQYDAYLSFTGGPTLKVLEDSYGSPMARVLYCSVDTELYRPHKAITRWDLGYLGTYSGERQPCLDEFLVTPARLLSKSKFVVAGPQYPENIHWPRNVERIHHLPPNDHPAFYASQRFTLNVTRAAMKEAGYSPSVRLFEAGACGVPVISDWWPGLDTLFSIGTEILIAENSESVQRFLRDTKEVDRQAMAARARQRIVSEHTPIARANQVKTYLEEMNDTASCPPRRNRRYWNVTGGAAARVASE